MLDAKADGEGLGFEEHAAPLEHAEGVARAVAQRQHHVAAAQSCSPLASTTPSMLAVLDQQVGDLALEAHLAAERDDLLAHRRHHAGEAEGADMRLADVEDLRRRAGAHELVHHLAAVELRILDLAVELAVGEQPRAALAELHVGFRVSACSCATGAQVSWVRRRTSRPRSSTIGLKPICASSSAANRPHGTEAHHERALLQLRGRLRHRVVGGVGRRAHLAVAREAPQHRRLVAHLHVDDADEQDALFFLRAS